LQKLQRGERMEPGVFASRLDQLFAKVHPAGRGPYSIDEVAQGTGLSARYVTNLRRGVQTNPTYRAIISLAVHFEVPPAYFFDDDGAAADVVATAWLCDPDLRRIVEIAARLSPSGLSAAADVVALLVRMEEKSPPEA
jgi:transcriptional regulator with XRE-family HTH domain